MVKNFKIEPTIYPYPIYVSYNDQKGLLKLITSEYDNIEQSSIDSIINSLKGSYLAKTLELGNGTIVLFFKTRDIATIVHEVFHAVYAIFENVHIPLSNDSEEAWAYYIGYLTQEILTKFK